MNLGEEGGRAFGEGGGRVEAVGLGQSCGLLLDVVLGEGKRGGGGGGGEARGGGGPGSRRAPTIRTGVTFSSSRSSFEGANMLLAIA
jgi:hypothetical protein